MDSLGELGEWPMSLPKNDETLAIRLGKLLSEVARRVQMTKVTLHGRHQSHVPGCSAAQLVIFDLYLVQPGTVKAQMKPKR